MNRRRAGSSSVGRSDFFLLYTYGCDELTDNSTTACTFTEATKTIKVTFQIADLRSLSYFQVSCPDLQCDPFTSRPEIVWSLEDVVLFRVELATTGSTEYFIYRARQTGCEPSLDLLPNVGSYFVRECLDPDLVGVIPDGEGKDFLLAVFITESGYHNLRVFRSKQRAWTKELLLPVHPSWPNFIPSKVIALRDGVLGYVDLWKGILLCKVLKEPVIAHFVPLPNLLPNNQEPYDDWSARSIRNVNCVDGLIIRCVEIESVTTSIPEDVLLDSNIDPTGEVEERNCGGWRLVTWCREISWDHWRKDCMFHVDELPQYRGSGKLPLRDLQTSCPILCGDDVVCLLSKWHRWDYNAWIVTIDTRNKTVGKLIPFRDERTMLYNPAYISCMLKKYLNSGSDGSSSLMEDTPFRDKRPQSFLDKTCNSSQQKRILRSSTMEQRRRHGQLSTTGAQP